MTDNDEQRRHDIVRITVYRYKCSPKYVIGKIDEFSLSRMSLHHPKCDCKIDHGIKHLFSYYDWYIFQSKDNKSEFCVIRKVIMGKVIDRCSEIFPCRKYNGILQMNGFPWIITRNLD